MQKTTPMKWLIGIVAVIVVAVVALIAAIDPVVEHLIETKGSEAVGARVDVGDTDVRLMPLGISLAEVAVTNPDAPMTNAVDIRAIDVALDTMPLLKRKVIVENMAMDGVRFNTRRSASGALPGRPATAATNGASEAGRGCGGASLPPLKMPDVTNILSTEKLASLEAVQKVQADIEAQKKQWQEQLANLPGPEAFKKYQQRMSSLTSGTGGIAAVLGGGGKLQRLKQEIENDLKQLKNAQRDLDKQIGALRHRLQKAAADPSADVRRLVNKYAIGTDSLSNMSRALMGEQFCGWVQKAMVWYERLRPVIDRQMNPETPSQKPSEAPPSGPADGTPDFLVKKARINVELEMGSLTGSLRNITPSPELLAEPAAFFLTGEQLKKASMVKISGVLDHRQPGNARDQLAATIQGLVLEGLNIAGNTGLPVVIEKAIADINIDSTLQNGLMDALVKTGLKQARISASAAGSDDPLASALAAVLEDLSELAAEADIKGSFDDYTVNIRSEVDRILKSALSRVVKKQTAVFQNRLQTAIGEKLQGPLQSGRQRLDGLGDVQQQLAGRLDMGNNLLGGKALPF